jgi:hypothetical protein
MHLSEVEVYPNYIYVQIYNLLIPNLVGFILTIVYYVKHPEMARSLLQHMSDWTFFIPSPLHKAFRLYISPLTARLVL